MTRRGTASVFVPAGVLVAAALVATSLAGPRERPASPPEFLEPGSVYVVRGEPGAACDTASLAVLEAEAAALRAELAALRSGGLRDCPTGMVPVGAFCIDRYEASIWDDPACDGVTGRRYGESSDDYPSATFPDNGNATAPLYACSLGGIMPSRGITWFQAQQACVASGKHLCTNEEWQAAAAGTPDDDTSCNISTGGPEPAGSRTACASRHGADDMVGNLWELVGWWGQAGRTWMSEQGQAATPWTAAYGADATYNLNGTAWNGTAYAGGMPAIARRGGDWGTLTDAGVFAVSLNDGPAAYSTVFSFGFRCCRAR